MAISSESMYVVKTSLYFEKIDIWYFRFQEIDGKALLLLNSEMMMKYMGLKLGPALKICNLVNKVNGRRNNLAL